MGSRASGFQNGTRSSSRESAGETSAGHGLDGREMFQNFQSGLASSFPGLEMSDKGGTGDVVRLPGGSSDGAHCWGGATLKRTLSAKLIKEDPRSGLWPGVLEPGWARYQVPRCQLLAGCQVGRRELLHRSSAPGWSTSVGVSVTVVVVVVTTVGRFPRSGNAGCTEQLRLAITREVLEDDALFSIQPWMAGSWSGLGPRSMAARREVTTGRTTHLVG